MATPTAFVRQELLAAKLPPLVTSWEINALRAQLAEATRGERFLLPRLRLLLHRRVGLALRFGV